LDGQDGGSAANGGSELSCPLDNNGDRGDREGAAVTGLPPESPSWVPGGCGEPPQ